MSIYAKTADGWVEVAGVSGGGGVTVSDRTPDAADGSDGEWWITTPPSTFALPDEAEHYARYNTRGSSMMPAANFMNLEQDPDHTGPALEEEIEEPSSTLNTLFYKDNGEWITVVGDSPAWHTVSKNEPVSTGNVVVGQVHYQLDIPHEVAELRSTLGASTVTSSYDPYKWMYCLVDSLDPNSVSRATFYGSLLLGSHVKIGDEIRLWQSPVQWAAGVITDIDYNFDSNPTSIKIEFDNTHQGSTGHDFSSGVSVQLLHTRSEDWIDWLATDSGWVERNDHHPATYGEQAGVTVQDEKIYVYSGNWVYRDSPIDSGSYNGNGFEGINMNSATWEAMTSFTPYYLSSGFASLTAGDLILIEGGTPVIWDDDDDDVFGGATTGSAIYMVTGRRDYLYEKYGEQKLGTWFDVEFIEWGEDGPLSRVPGVDYTQPADERPFTHMYLYRPTVKPSIASVGVDPSE